MNKLFGVALAATLSLLAARASAVVIYQETFGGAGGALNGKAVGPTAATWEAGPVFLDNGAVGAVVSIETDRPDDAVDVLPAVSVDLAVIVWPPSASAEAVIDQLPPVAVAVPNTVVPSVS